MRTLLIVVLLAALVAGLASVVTVERYVERRVTLARYAERGEAGQSSTVVRLSIAALPHRWESGRAVVYFAAPFEGLAKDVAQALDQALALIKDQMGMDAAIEVALFPEPPEWEEGGNVRVVVKEAVWPLFVEASWRRLADVDFGFVLFLYNTLPHEAVEGAVSRYLYHDRRARWVGDGLAEYAGYLVSRRWAPSIAEARLENLRERVADLLGQGKGVYDLLQEFRVRAGDRPWPSTPVEAAGYGVSLALWLDLTQRHGEGVIRAFWERLRSHKPWCLIPPYLVCIGPDAETAARVLSELTGEAIWAKLQRMDLQEVLEILKRAAQEIPEG